MTQITITSRTHNTWMSVLGFSEHYLTKQKKDHEKWLVGYYDKHKNFHYENPKTTKDVVDIGENNKFVSPVYVLNPWVENKYEIVFENEIIELELCPLKRNDISLYKSVDNPSVFEPMSVIIITCKNEEIITKFLTESYDYLLYAMKFKSTDEVTLWVWTEDYWRRTTSALAKRCMTTIYLPENDKTRVINDIERFLSTSMKEKYRMFGIPYHRTYCFHGLAGTGKTSFIHALASTYNKNIAILPFDPKLTDAVLIDVMTRIPENCFLVLEDFDLIFDETTSNSKTNISLSAFLNCLDGLPSKSEQIVFLTTNNYITLNPVICRPGRIDIVIEFKEIVKSQLFIMLEKFFPSQKEKYEDFYDKIKDKKITTCMMQHYLFERYPDKDILHNVEKVFSDMIKTHRISGDGNYSLYT